MHIMDSPHFCLMEYKYINRQGRPEKLRGPGQRVKVGPFTQLYNEDQKKKKKKKKGHNLLAMTITTHHQPYLLIYKLATLLL